jgi:predicted dehydrogenase
MSEKVRVGVIGVGQIGKGHVRTYQVIPEADVVAICDLCEEEAERVAAQFNVPDIYLDYHDLLARDDIDAVDVCLHNRLHRPVTVDALQAGKNVYCEKPMSWNYQDAKVMYDAAQETGKMLHIQLGRIYRPSTVGAKRLIDQGHLGEIYAVRSVHYRRRGRPWVDGYGSPAFVSTGTAGGGALIDYGVYNISRILFLLGNPPVQSVSGVAAQKLDMYGDRAESAGYDVEEYVMGFVRLGGGITWSLEEAWAVHADSPEEIRIFGDQGGMRVEPLSYHTTLADIEMDATFDVEKALWRWNQTDPQMKHVFNVDLPYHQNSQRHWISAQLGYVDLLPTAEIGLRTTLISDGIYLSSHLGREVTMDEIENAEPGVGRAQDRA